MVLYQHVPCTRNNSQGVENSTMTSILSSALHIKMPCFSWNKLHYKILEEPDEKHFQAIPTLHKAYIYSYAILYNIDIFKSNLKHMCLYFKHMRAIYTHRHWCTYLIMFQIWFINTYTAVSRKNKYMLTCIVTVGILFHKFAFTVNTYERWSLPNSMRDSATWPYLLITIF